MTAAPICHSEDGALSSEEPASRLKALTRRVPLGHVVSRCHAILRPRQMRIIARAERLAMAGEVRVAAEKPADALDPHRSGTVLEKLIRQTRYHGPIDDDRTSAEVRILVEHHARRAERRVRSTRPRGNRIRP